MTPQNLDYNVHISAAGEGSRMRAEMDRLGLSASFPKHLLPTGSFESETLVGRIARQAKLAPQIGYVTLYANTSNVEHFRSNSDLDKVDSIVIGSNGPFETLHGQYLEQPNPIISTSGDFFTTMPWSKILQFHRSHDLPVTYLVGQSCPTEKAAVFNVTDGKAVSWHRAPGQTQPEDLINVGLYVFDQHPGVREIIAETNSYEPEPNTDALIEAGLIAACVAEGTVYNVNNPSVYNSLLSDNRLREAV